MSEALKPCPFCGNKNIEIRGNGNGDYYCICAGDEDEMHCEASTSDRRCESQEQAINRWNQRASEKPAIAPACPHCAALRTAADRLAETLEYVIDIRIIRCLHKAKRVDPICPACKSR